MAMRLLLIEDVRKLGHVGDVVEVAPGYGRNYLLPQRLATWPTEENLKSIEDKKKVAAAERARKLNEYTQLVEQMQAVSITIERAANPEGTLYGGVHERDIAEALQAQGFAVRADHVILDTPIRSLDKRQITLEFTDELRTQIELWVVREGGALHVDDTEPEDRGETPDDDEDERPRGRRRGA